MIRFEACETSTSRTVPSDTKVLVRAIVPSDPVEMATSSEGLFADEGGASSEEQGTGSRKARGRSKKFRGSSN